MSNILDRVLFKELKGRKVAKRSHGKMVASPLPGSQTPGKILEGIKTVPVIKALLVFSVASLYLAVHSNAVSHLVW